MAILEIKTNYNTALLSLTAENTSTRGLAENLQYFRESIYHPLVALNPEGSEERPAGARTLKPTTTGLRSITVAPNPFQQEVVFDLSGIPTGEPYQLQIADFLGRIVFSQQIYGGMAFRWQTTQVSDGKYFYQIRSEKGTLQSGTLLKGLK
ncbi:MAG: T9SS type A sorting domain-containing protein [Saprospiraceae bacterium]|nr:T9SS type A sorting domain-containing protein [Saprospiraceae bacterium]